MILALRNASVFDGEAMMGPRTVLIEKGRIMAVAANDAALPDGVDVEDLGGKLLVPGFVDVQVNGGGGVMFNNDRTAEGLATIVDGHRRYGTTTVMPTLITDTVEVMRDAADAVRGAIAARLPGVRGVHFEGPCLSPERKGVHRKEYFRSYAPELDEIYTGEGMGKVMVTLAPERVGARDIAGLADRGVLVCAGHTAGTYGQISESLKAGLRGFTHLYNAMTPMTNREPGVVGAALDDGDTWCGLIVDGYHLHDATARNAVRSKARGKIMLVTDAMGTVGSKVKSFVLYGTEIFASEGRCATADGTLAGSDLDMMAAVRNTHRNLGVTLEESLRMASLYPAEFLGLAKVIGRIAPGYDADLAAIDRDTLTVTRTWIGGEGKDAAA